MQTKKSAVAIEKQKQKSKIKTKQNKTKQTEQIADQLCEINISVMLWNKVQFSLFLTGYLLAIITNIITHLELNVQ